MLKYILLLLNLAAFTLQVFAQNPALTIDKVVAVVGEKPILLSEVSAQFEQMKAQNPTADSSMYCVILAFNSSLLLLNFFSAASSSWPNTSGDPKTKHDSMIMVKNFFI
jgi:hypothetical protein